MDDNNRKNISEKQLSPALRGKVEYADMYNFQFVYTIPADSSLYSDKKDWMNDVVQETTKASALYHVPEQEYTLTPAHLSVYHFENRDITKNFIVETDILEATNQVIAIDCYVYSDTEKSFLVTKSFAVFHIMST